VKLEIAAIGQKTNYRYHEFSYGASIDHSALDWTLVRMHVVLDVALDYKQYRQIYPYFSSTNFK